MTTAYLRALKWGLTGDPATPLVFVPDFGSAGPLRSRLAELGALLAGPHDALVLTHPLDRSYVEYLASLGFPAPRVLIADGGGNADPVSARVLQTPGLTDTLRDWGERGAWLVADGEQRLAESAGLRLAGSDPDTFLRVNSASYRKRLVYTATGDADPTDAQQALTSQVIVHSDGTVRLNSPAARGVEEAAQAIGRALYADGFTGLLTMDGKVGADGTVFPAVDVHPRLTEATYLGAVQQTLGCDLPVTLPGKHVLRLTEPLEFTDIREALGPLLIVDPIAGGVVVSCFGTLNAQAGGQWPVEGHLHTLAIGPDQTTVTALNESVRTALEVRTA